MRCLALVVLVACLAVGHALEEDVKEYSYEFDVPSNGTTPITTDFTKMCAGDMQVARRLFKFAVCHSTNDQVGRRKRKPHPQCPFAVVGIRATVMLDQMATNIEQALGLPEGELSNLQTLANQLRSTFHQSLVYGDADGHMDFASGFFCGEGNMLGRQWGYICQDDDRLVNMYVPITNNTLALDNWFPVQYNLVGRKFDCNRLWRAEMQLSRKFDACASPSTAVDYMAVMRNCHMYVNEVVLLYDRMMEEEGKLPIDHEWSSHEPARLKGMMETHEDDDALASHVADQLKVEKMVWSDAHASL
jgi:hypothetical protein